MAPAARGKKASRSLRLRLTLWFVAFFSVLHLVLLGAVPLFRRDLVRRSNEGHVASLARALVDNVLVENPAWTEAELLRLVPRGAPFVFLAVRRPPEGEVVVSWGVSAPNEIPFTARETVPAGPLGPVFSRVEAGQTGALAPDDQPLGLLTLPFRYRGELLYLQAGVPESQLEGALRPFLDLFVLAIPLASLAALLAAWALSGRAVRPLLSLSRAARDVSPSRIGERIRLDTHDEEVSALQGELNEALARLEAGFRAQEEFVSNASHELKTPIAVLRSESQLLSDGEADPERYRAFVRSVEEETQRLGRLVESFLSLARQGWSRELLHPSRVAAADLVLDAVRHVGPLAERAGVSLVPRVEPSAAEEAEVEGDEELLGTMLENLLRNAVRFSPEGGRVVLEARCEGRFVVIVVMDEGPGIPDELLGTLFQRHVGRPDPRGSRGEGIGLAIAQRVAELHGGAIAARNVEGAGACFSVSLPRRSGGARI